MKSCSICKAEIESENPSILTMGGYGNPRYVCEDCDAEIERMLYSREPAEAQDAMKKLGAHMARIGCEDNAVIATMQEMMHRAGERARAISEGTYDFAEDSPEQTEEELVEIPEELQETEEDRALDEKDAEAEKKFDKIMNRAWAGILAAFVIYFAYIIIRRYI